MSIWLALAMGLMTAVLCAAVCLAYVLVALARLAPLIGTRVGLIEIEVLKVEAAPGPARRRPHPRYRADLAPLPTRA